MKGWAVEVDDSVGFGGLRERLAGNHVLWIACLLVILAITAIFVIRSSRAPANPSVQELVEDPVGVYTDSAHRQFALDIVQMARKRGVRVQAKFLSDRDFRLVMPCDVMTDEIRFLARAAATGIWRRFRANPTVWTYMEDNQNPVPRLTATTTWSSEKADFVVKFERAIESE